MDFLSPSKVLFVCYGKKLKKDNLSGDRIANGRKTIASNAGNFYLTSAVFCTKRRKTGGLARRGRGDNSAEKGGLGGTDVPPGCNDTTALTY